MLQHQTTSQGRGNSQRIEADVTIQTAARLLGTTQKRLFDTLRAIGLLDRNNRPARTYVRQGLVATQPSTWQHPITKRIHQYDRPMLTQQGIDWLRQQGLGQ